jgi:putative nucleotidyltransferase with HDIG domain
MELKSTAIQVVNTLQTAGFIAYWAGGCVRDLLLDRTPVDYDVATDASPDQVAALFEVSHHIGQSFLVTHVVENGFPFEIAAFRREAGYLDGRHPSEVEPSDPEEDASRRDFTINGIFYDPMTETVIDFIDGQKDLKRGVVRAIGDPLERFREDHLRMLRAVRFASVMGFEIESKTFAAIQQKAHEITKISSERTRDELTRMLLESQKPGEAIKLLHDTGLLAEIIPEAIPMIGCEQPPKYHPEGDVFKHTCLMLDLLPERTLALVWSVLLHDIGKPPTQEMGVDQDGSPRWRFNGHAQVGAKMSEEILDRLKFSNDDKKAIIFCVDHHMDFMNVKKMRVNNLRKMVGRPTFETELALHYVDCKGSSGFMDHHEFMTEFVRELANTPALPEPLVSGRDIMGLGITEGPEIGRWKNLAFDQQLCEPAWEQEQVLAWLREAMSDSG